MSIETECLKVINDCDRRAKDNFYKDYPDLLKDDVRLKKRAQELLNKLNDKGE